MVQVIWPDRATELLRNIHDFIAEDDPQAAQRAVRGILKKTDMLRRFPYLGQAYPEEKGLRALTHGHYRILYVVDEDKGEIVIAGVFHGRMDIPRHLKRRS